MTGLARLRRNGESRCRGPALSDNIVTYVEMYRRRSVFKFRMVAVEGDENLDVAPSANPARRRLIPTAVKLAVWKRDAGKCLACGARDELHFDHDLPWSKGGTSLTEANAQLCAHGII